MRRAAAALCVALAGCAAVPPPPSVPSLPPVPAAADDTCGAGPHAGLVGQPATALERVLIMRPVRLIRPGTPVTEDFSAARINFHIDGFERISAISCG